MPGPSNSTPVLELPIPDGTDDADAPTDFETFALRVEELLLGGDDGIAGWAVGDLKPSARSTSHGRWLLCDTERELTQAEIESELSLDAGQAAAIVALLGTGATSRYGTAATDKVKIPGFKGVVPVGVSTDHPIKGAGSSGGEETHTLSTSEIPSHSHGAGSLAAASHSHGSGTLGGDDHAHFPGGLTVASHSHGVGSLATSTTGDHKHSSGSLSATTAGGHSHTAAGKIFALATGGTIIASLLASFSGSDLSGAVSTVFGHTHDVSGFTNTDGAHSHSMSGSVATAAPAVIGNTGGATLGGTTISGATASQGASVTGTTGTAGSGTAHNVMQPYRTIGYWFIRV